MSVNHEIEDMKTRMAVLTERVEGWMSTTTDYRKALCTKVDSIIDKVSALPCKERKAFYDNASIQLKLLWSILVLMLGAIIVEWLKIHK